MLHGPTGQESFIQRFKTRIFPFNMVFSLLLRNNVPRPPRRGKTDILEDLQKSNSSYSQYILLSLS